MAELLVRLARGVLDLVVATEDGSASLAALSHSV